MDRLRKVADYEDIFPEFRGTPVGLLLEYHNLDRQFDSYSRAELLVGMCMDNRKFLRTPDNFAFVLRTGGGNLRYSEFKVSYAVGIGKVKAIALIAHNQCGMVNLYSKKADFVAGLVENGGWEPQRAEEHFDQFAPFYEISNEVDFVLLEAQRMRTRYPNILVAPLFYQIEDNLLYQIQEN